MKEEEIKDINRERDVISSIYVPKENIKLSNAKLSRIVKDETNSLKRKNEYTTIEKIMQDRYLKG